MKCKVSRLQSNEKCQKLKMLVRLSTLFPPLLSQDKMKDSLRRESVVDIQDDGDPYWFNNPQYRLSADEPVEVGHIIVSMVHQGVRPSWDTITMPLFAWSYA